MIDINIIKQYMKINDDSENEILALLLSSVMTYLEKYLNISKQQQLPADLTFAILDHIAYLYDNRGVNGDVLPKKVQNIYLKYKKIVI